MAVVVVLQRHRYSNPASVSSSPCPLKGPSSAHPCSADLVAGDQANTCHHGHLPTILREKMDLGVNKDKFRGTERGKDVSWAACKHL